MIKKLIVEVTKFYSDGDRETLRKEFISPFLFLQTEGVGRHLSQVIQQFISKPPTPKACPTCHKRRLWDDGVPCWFCIYHCLSRRDNSGARTLYPEWEGKK